MYRGAGTIGMRRMRRGQALAVEYSALALEPSPDRSCAFALPHCNTTAIGYKSLQKLAWLHFDLLDAAACPLGC
jgi:hypothetical protein